MAPDSTIARIFLAACLFFLPTFFSHHVAAATSPPPSFNFDFSNPSKYRIQDIRFEGDAVLNGNLIDLTSVTCNYNHYFCSGRMSYNQPVFLYDNNTGELASFVTTFTFAINMFPNTTTRGDGIAFFLSGYPSRLPPSSGGSVYGLRNRTTTILSGDDRFVAVEFDTFNNREWDSISTDHIGIDLSSLTSVNATRLPSNLNGTMMATITFDNATRILEATLQFGADGSLVPTSVKAQLDLDALLPPVVSVGFSAGTGLYSELHQIISWSFNSTMVARETPGGANPEHGPVVSIKVGRLRRALVITGLILLVVVLLLALLWLFLWIRARRRWKQTRGLFGEDTGIKRFHYLDLYIATRGFSHTKKIGEGGFSAVYSGSLSNKKVAVKKILKDSNGQFKDFLAERSTIAQIRHMNVVKLEGWCCSISNSKFWCSHTPDDVKLFLVYEFVDNGNLHHHLYEKQVLSWETRYNIVKGLCSALHYLHHQCSNVILHRDIKPSNILLDKAFNAKLGDFGLSRVVQDSSKRSLNTRAVGSELYMDPLCMQHGQIEFGPSSDVYSVGIVLLEIVHGSYNLNLFRKLRTDRPATFVNDFADPNLAGKFNNEQMERVIVLGFQCSDPDDASRRPSLDGAILQFLEKGGELHPATALQQTVS